jgi:threonine dehydrogenase-like Zn-dependent dehydrogenase
VAVLDLVVFGRVVAGGGGGVGEQVEIYGSHGMAAHEYPPMLALVADGTLRPDLLLGKVIGLEEAATALAAMDRLSPSAGMTVIELPR